MNIAERVKATLSFLTVRKQNYQRAFGNPWGEQVLIDLATFCRANETCVIPGDHDRTLLLEGRREVWLRIAQHMNLSPEQLFALYTKRPMMEDKND
jgi:hypothetical protein